MATLPAGVFTRLKPAGTPVLLSQDEIRALGRTLAAAFDDVVWPTARRVQVDNREAVEVHLIFKVFHADAEEKPNVGS